MDEFTSKARRELIADLATDPDGPDYGYDVDSLARVLTDANLGDLIGSGDTTDYVTEALALIIMEQPALLALAIRGGANYRERFFDTFNKLMRIELARELERDVNSERSHYNRQHGPLYRKRGYESLRDMQFDDGMELAKRRIEDRLTGDV